MANFGDCEFTKNWGDICQKSSYIFQIMVINGDWRIISIFGDGEFAKTE